MEIVVFTLRQISTLDAGTKVELKYEAKQQAYEGELYLRVPKAREAEFKLGDSLAVKVRPL